MAQLLLLDVGFLTTKKKKPPSLIKRDNCVRKDYELWSPRQPFLSAQSGVRRMTLETLQCDGSICLCENNTLSVKGFLPHLLNPIPLQSSLVKCHCTDETFGVTKSCAYLYQRHGEQEGSASKGWEEATYRKEQYQVRSIRVRVQNV